MICTLYPIIKSGNGKGKSWESKQATGLEIQKNKKEV